MMSAKRKHGLFPPPHNQSLRRRVRGKAIEGDGKYIELAKSQLCGGSHFLHLPGSRGELLVSHFVCIVADASTD